MRIILVIKMIDFLTKYAILNINVLNFSLYSTRWMLFNFYKYFLINVNSLKSLYASQFFRKFSRIFKRKCYIILFLSLLII